MEELETQRGLILLIEDDALVQEVVCHHLRNNGYEVLVAPDAEQARSLMVEHGDHVRLLLVDSGLPIQSGESIADELKSRFGRTRVLLVSGYPRPRDPADESFPFLQKPITGAQLVAKVDELLAHGN
jgi:DNA-binding response OmpR family regulator